MMGIIFDSRLNLGRDILRVSGQQDTDLVRGNHGLRGWGGGRLRRGCQHIVIGWWR